MTILAFDFTSEHGSLAIRRHGETLIEQGLHSPGGFSHLVFPAIDELLRQTGIRLGEIDCFASASGPGAFTGVRVGLSAVKGLAEALSKKAIGVSNLRAVASFGNLPSRAVVLDARRGDVFTAVYDASLNPIIPEAVGKLDAFLRNLPGRPDQFLTPGVDWLRAALETTPLAYIPVIEVSRGLASAVAQCAERDLHRDVTGNPAALDANYVRRSDAELFWKDV